MSDADRGLLAIFLDEARMLVDRATTGNDPAIARELAELAGVIGDAELIELATGLRTALERHLDPIPAATLVGHKLTAIATPPPAPSTWDPAELAEIRALFLVEARTHLVAIEQALVELRADPTSRTAYDALFRKMHTLKGSAGSVDLHALSAAAHRLEDVLAMARNQLGPALLEAVSASIPEIRRLIGTDETTGEQPAKPSEAKASQPASTSTSERESAKPSEAKASQPARTSTPETRGTTTPETRATSTSETRAAPARWGEARRALLDEGGRERPPVLDEVLDTASELVLDRTRIERRLRSVDELARTATPELRAELSELAADVASLSRTTRRLGERLRRLRAVELSTLVRRFEPVIQATARRERKQVRLVVRGGTEEIDQRLADALVEPLLHLVRNAVVHGVEAPATRLTAGKPTLATITISLREVGDGLELEIADDGAGVDLDAVRRALVAAERLTPEEAAALAPDAVFATLFQPGISTRAQTDDLAGRGVGLDVVADAIARLGGDVAVASTPGQGSRFSIRVPVESRVLEALLFKVGDQLFAVPSARVEEVLDIGKGETSSHLDVEGERLSLLSLGALLALPPPPGAGETRSAIVLVSRGQRFAVTCDRVVGPREVVVRRLPPSLTGLRPWAGATISGAGKVQLIFDVDALALSAAPAARPAQPIGPVRVLIVDEARSTRDAVALVLEHAGFTTERAPDGWEALELLADRPFDVVLCRLEQEGLPGASLVGRIRASSHLHALPIVLLTELAEDEARRSVDPHHPATVDAVLTLPLRRRGLLDAIELALKS